MYQVLGSINPFHVSEMALSQGYPDRLKFYVYLEYNNIFILFSFIKNQKQRISNVFY